MEKLEDINVKYWELANAGNLGHHSNRDYSAKCPICGDSQKKKKLKRCHLFTKAGWDHDVIHCFNCNWKGNMYTFLETVNPHLYNSYKNEKRATSLNNLVRTQQPKEEEPLPDIDVSFFDSVRQSPPKVFDLPEQFKVIEQDDEFYKYLMSRCMTPKQINMFRKCDGIITYNGQNIALEGYIILPLWYNDKVYGFQARSIKDKMFYTFVPEENHGYKVWNWFNVNVDETIYVFESYFDALSSGLDNVVAQLGATLSEDRLNEVNDIVFVLDNQRVDPTAKVESIKYAKKGHKVMIWPPNKIKFKDFNEILKSGGTREKISEFIKRNIDEGLTAEVKLKVE